MVSRESQSPPSTSLHNLKILILSSTGLAIQTKCQVYEQQFYSPKEEDIYLFAAIGSFVVVAVFY